MLNTWSRQKEKSLPCCYQVCFHSINPRALQHAALSGNGWHGLGFIFTPAYVVKMTVASSNGASSRGHLIKKGGVDFLEGSGFVCSIVISNISCFGHCCSPEVFISVVMHNIVLVSWAQFFEGKVVKAVVNNHGIKLVGSLEGVVKASDSTIVNGNRQLDFAGGLAHSSGDSTKKIDQFVVRRV